MRQIFILSLPRSFVNSKFSLFEVKKMKFSAPLSRQLCYHTTPEA
jgi:hypothetical protein